MVEISQAFDEKEISYSQIDEQTPTVEGVPLQQSSSPVEGEEDKRVAPGVTGAVLGFLLGGPIGSALVGFTAAYLSQKDGPQGDIARNLGDIGLYVQAKAMEIEEQHKIVDSTTKAATEVWEHAKKFDENTQILETSRGFFVAQWFSLVRFVEERRLLEQGVDTAGKGYEFVAEKLSPSSNNSSN